MLPTSLHACKLSPFWKKLRQKAHSAHSCTCYWPLQPQCKTKTSPNKPPKTGREGMQRAQHLVCGRVDQLLHWLLWQWWQLLSFPLPGQHSFTSAQHLKPHSVWELLILPSAWHPTVTSSSSLDPERLWDVLLSWRLALHKPWASIPSEILNSKLNWGTFEIWGWMERKLLPTSAQLLHRNIS